MIIPRFRVHLGKTAILEEESWKEIFDSEAATKCPKFHFWRKCVKVRIATRDGIFIPQDQLLGIFPAQGDIHRKVYGEMIFHTRHENDKNIPYQNMLQLTVKPNIVYTGYVASVSIYFTENTRLSDQTWNRHLELGDKIPITDEDYEYELLRTTGMKDFKYCPPPLTYK